MKKIIFIAIMGLLISSCGGNKAEVKEKQEVKTFVSGSKDFAIDIESSKLNWTAFHKARTMSRKGTVNIKSGNVAVKDGEITAANFVFDIASLNVTSLEGDDKKHLEKHLKSGDFFEIESHPTALFELTEYIKTNKDGFNAKVSGNLTMKGVTKNISFYANYKYKEDKFVFETEEFTLNRIDWGLEYNKEGTSGLPEDYIISNDIDFKIRIIASDK